MTKQANHFLSKRKLPIGAEIVEEGIHFRVWAPDRKKISVVIENCSHPYPLHSENNGYFSSLVTVAEKNMLYRFQLDEDNFLYPDPASRFQPFGPHGPSQIMKTHFPWTDHHWRDYG